MPVITEMFAFIATEAPGEEGVAAVRLGDRWMPLFGADPARMESLRQMAQGVADTSGMPLTLARFTVREDLATIVPAGAGAA